MIGIEYAFALKFIHILAAAVLFGTGLGIAFFTWMAHRAGDVATIAAIAPIVVVADAIFIATAVIVQPVSGALLAWSIGYSLLDGWIAASLILYVLVGLCWLPVVVIQIRMRDLARAALKNAAPLPQEYHRLYAIWFWLGWPAFAGVLAIFAAMIWKPVMW
jgi:uncharacterized membrane protein